MRKAFVSLSLWISIVCFINGVALAAPYRVWSTYFGGPGNGIGSNDNAGGDFSPDVGRIGSDDIHEDGAYGVAVNPATGDTYITGFTTAPSGVASGGLQNSLAGNRDAFVAKIGPNGQKQWATYYGGAGGIGSDTEDRDTGLQIAVNPTTGDSYVVGITNSTTGIASSGAYQTSLSGTRDGFIAKFDTSGARQWGTYFGGAGVAGSDEEAATGVAVNSGTGEVYVVGYTRSTSGIASAGSYQPAAGGGSDGWLAKFSAAGARLWATYFGGTGDDYGKGVAVDSGTGDVYLVGSTKSSNGIASGGAHQTALQGTQDSFVAKFDAGGARQWATYFGGVGSDDDKDAGVGIAVNAATHDVYVTGNTNSAAGIATAGAQQTTNNGYRSPYLAKFNSAGVRQWGTYYGGVGSDDFASGVAVETSTGQIFLSGGTSSDNVIATAGAQQSLRGGGVDGFVAKFDANGVRQWGTYYGDTGFDFITGVAPGANAGELRVVGRTQSGFDMATAGSQSPGKVGVSDAFIASLNETTPSPPANNDFNNAVALNSLGSVVTQSTTGASKESGEPNHAGSAGGASVWFRWTAPVSGTIAIHTAGSKFDTLLGIYTGSVVSGLSAVASNNDFTGPASKATFSAVAGTTYRIAVDGVAGASGALRLSLGPVNDEFAARITIPATGGTFTGTNVGASTEIGEQNHGGRLPQKTVWWTWTPDHDGPVEINTIGSEIDTALAVYTDSSFPLQLIRGDTAIGGDPGRVSFFADAGTTYQIAVGSVDGDEGNVTLQVVAPPFPPVNDAFAARTNLNSLTGVFSGSTLSATVEAGEPNHAGNTPGGSVWWTWVAPTSAEYKFVVAGGSSSNSVSVYTGAAINSLTAVGTRSPFSYDNVTLSATAGTMYQIAVDSPFGDPSTFKLVISPPATVPLNDNFASRIALSGTSPADAANNTLATKEAGEPDHADQTGGHSVWWSWTAPASGPVQIDTFDSTFDTLLAVYTGTALNTLSVVASNDDFSSSQSRVVFNAVAHVTYQIAVDGYDDATDIGTAFLNISLSPDGGSYGLWLESFPGLTGSARDRSADPDQDGYSNELEMVLGLNPTIGSQSGGGDSHASNRPVLTRTATTLVLQYTLDPAYVGVSYSTHTPVMVTGQVSASLAPNSWTNVAPIPMGGNSYKIEVPFGTDARKFLRLMVIDPNAP